MLLDFNNWILSIDDPAGDQGGGAGGAGGEGGGSGAEGAEGADAPAGGKGITQEQLSQMIDKAVKPLQDRIADLHSTNVILQGMVRDSGQSSAQPATPAASAAPALPDKDKFIDDMNRDPVGTLLTLIDTHVAPKLNQRVDQVKTETQQEQAARQQLERAIGSDQSAALEIANQWTDGSDERALFDQYGEEELGKLCPTVMVNGKRMPDPRVFRPGMIEQAALRAERRLRAEGKIPAPAVAANGNSNTNRVVQFPRANPKPSPGAPQGGAPAPAKTIDDLVSQGKLSASDATIAKSNCRKWQMDESRFVANFLDMERENPHYGSGL